MPAFLFSPTKSNIALFVFALSFVKAEELDPQFGAGTLIQQLERASLKLNPLKKGIKNPYLSCQFGCLKYSGEEKAECHHKCDQLDYSSENSEYCLLKCAGVYDPLNQQQCISSCRRYKRLDYSNDYSDGCERCQSIFGFVRTLLHKFSDSELAEAFKTVCTTQPNILPVCQAIGTTGFEVVLQHLLSEESTQEICKYVKLC